MLGESEEVLNKFLELMAAGESPGIASILASRKPPGCETDTAHYVGLKPLEESIGKGYADMVKKQARDAGIAISDNSRFNATVCDDRVGGDPNAWTHAGDGRSTLRERLKQRGGGGEDFGLEVNTDLVSDRMAKKKQRIMGNRARQAEQAAETAQG
jgi:hypothetical protein